MNNPPILGARVVCSLDLQPDEARFVWSDTTSFPPYLLTGNSLREFRESAANTRRTLRELAHEEAKVLVDAERVVELSRQLAICGYELFERMFEPTDDAYQSPAKDVREWLEELGEHITSIEVIFKGPAVIPWNAIYVSEPPALEKKADTTQAAFWTPFWGVSRNLAVGRHVSPARRLMHIDGSRLVAVLDRKEFDLLGDEKQNIQTLFAEKNVLVVHSFEELKKACENGPPSFLYWFGHATPEALHLNGELIHPKDLYKLLRRQEAGRGIVFLNACRTGQEASNGNFLDAVLDAGLTGIILTEEETVNTFANRFAHLFLDEFVKGERSIAEIMRSIRSVVQKDEVEKDKDTLMLPLGLLYTSCCPPGLRMRTGDGRTAPPPPIVAAPRVVEEAADASIPPPSPARARALFDLIVDAVPTPGVLGPPAVPAVRALLSAAPVYSGRSDSIRGAADLPDEPYPSLAAYDRNRRSLFTGRTAAVEQFAALIDTTAVAGVILHGESGVGKSSFIRAGLIPYLEIDCVGYRFVRDRSPTPEAGATVTESPALFIRATDDPAAQIAVALHNYCATKFVFTPPRGAAVEVDLAKRLRLLIGKEPSQANLREWLSREPENLAKALKTITAPLPFALVLVLDQCEEIFTLAANTEKAHAVRAHSLAMLHAVHNESGNFKVLLSLRTEYFGRLVDALRGTGRDAIRYAEYLLHELNESDIERAILRPTEFTEKYPFTYEDNLAHTIAQDVLKTAAESRDSALPLMQMVCTQLYARARGKPKHVLKKADYDAIGGVVGGMRTHVETLVRDLATNSQGQYRAKVADAFRELCTHLYNDQDAARPTALLSVSKLEKYWTQPQRAPLTEILDRAVALKLLRVTAPAAGRGDKRYSLGHDALAHIAASWKEERKQRAAKWQAIWLAIVGVPVLALLVVTATWWAVHLKKQREIDEKEGEIISKQTEVDTLHGQLTQERQESAATTIAEMKMLLGSEERLPNETVVDKALSISAAAPPALTSPFCVQSRATSALSGCRYETEDECRKDIGDTTGALSCVPRPTATSCFPWVAPGAVAAIARCFPSTESCQRTREKFATYAFGRLGARCEPFTPVDAPKTVLATKTETADLDAGAGKPKTIEIWEIGLRASVGTDQIGETAQGARVYTYRVYVHVPTGKRGLIKSVVYKFYHPDWKDPVTGDAKHDFGHSYPGYGCIHRVDATITLNTGGPPFVKTMDMCTAIERSRASE